MADSAVSTVVSLAGPSIIEQLKYLFCARENVRDLRKAMADLEVTKREVQGKIKRAMDASAEEVPTERVEKWLSEKVIRYLEDESMDVIGIWGMGGVGKLLTRINNHPYVRFAGLDFVIWVVVSQELNLEKIQLDIANRLKFNFDEHTRTTLEARAESIHHFLKNKTFLLLLDDLWKAFDLDMVGIPISSSCKVVITSRFESVCDELMSARHSQLERYMKIKLERLKPDEAWRVFYANIGRTAQELIKSEARVSNYARRIADKCAGSPLALVVIARAMSSNKTWHEWEDAATSMDELRIQERLGENSDSLFPILKVSYDRLANEQLKQCFLCCAFWPGGVLVSDEELIRHWLGIDLLAFIRRLRSFERRHLGRKTPVP